MLFYSEMKEVRMLRKRAILAGSGELKAKDRFFGASVEDGQQVHFILFYLLLSCFIFDMFTSWKVSNHTNRTI